MNSAIYSYHQFWAKSSDDDNEYHLLPYHNLDVAAVGYVLMDNDPALCRRLRKFLNPALAEDVAGFVSLLLSWHDVGKFAESFQNLRPDLLLKLQGKESTERYVLRHDSAGWLWFRHKSKHVQKLVLGGDAPFLQGCPGIADTLDVLDPLIRAIFGHHGMPPDQAKALSLGSSLFPEYADSAATSYIRDTMTLLCGRPIRLTSDESFSDDYRGANTAAWLLAGLAVMCDWIGSSPERFPFLSEQMPLTEYWRRHAQPRAETAIRRLGILPSRCRSFGGLTNIFPQINLLTPLQEVCSSITLDEGAQLFIIEDSTGAGKTEAAIALAHRLLADQRAQSVYFALPTMATANGIFERIKPVFHSLFEADSNPSLVLSHSRRDLSPAFKELTRQGNQITQTEGEDDPGEVGCVAWFSDSRKKALLASFGVGTIDQALVGVLPIKHQSLRLFGASRSVLVIDEVHAFDPYMSKAICVLLEFQATFGAPVILLSATLPIGLKEKFIAAYRRGLGLSLDRLPAINPYPSLDMVSRNPLQRISFPTRDSVRRQITISYKSDQDEICDCIASAVDAGKSVCWIRNTIADAISACALVTSKLQTEALSTKGTVRLFHSRFCFGDRQEIEESVLRTFGPRGGERERAGQVLIATQVVEQSLDLDFDVMITDLAPIDLIIQRAGRLMRHTRDARGNRISGPDERGIPRLCIYGPSVESEPTRDWYSGFFKAASFVYPHHGRLFLTANTLSRAKALRIPDDLRPVVEEVYSEDYLSRVPESLRHAEIKAEGADQGKTSLASINTLRVHDGYLRQRDEWSPDVDTPTRLSNNQITVTLVKVSANGVKPICPGESGWELSEVSLPAGYQEIEHSAEPDHIRRPIETCLGLPMHRWRKLVVVQERGNRYEGKIRKIKGGHLRRFTYDKIFGLELVQDDTV